MLGEYLDKFIIAYLNNIIIHSNSKKKHFQYMEQVLQRLIDKKMLVAIKKYKFYKIKTKFCKFIIKLEKLLWSRHEPEYNILNEVVIEKATYA